MKVAFEDDHATSIVLGGTEDEISFGVSSSAEFIQVLSSTLYSNQILAVVRETICNAWDAHIEAGITDRPIEITLENNQFIVRDFGGGIAHKDIGPIYAVYGASTKKNSKDSTGGFGLGCKSPFAYTDSFGVESMHEGKKHIYRMNKSSVETNGLPSVSTILSMDTEDSGLKVSIDIKPVDMETFEKEINYVVFTGDIKARLNGELLERIEYPENAPFVFTRRVDGLPWDVSIKYGNVIYPVPEHEAFCEELDRLTERLDSLRGFYYSSSRVILIAEPDSLSITPSRESLSVTDHTIASLSKLLKRTNKVIDKWHEYSRNWLNQQVDIQIENNKLPLIIDGGHLERNPELPSIIYERDPYLHWFYSENTVSPGLLSRKIMKKYREKVDPGNRILKAAIRALGKLSRHINSDLAKSYYDVEIKPLIRDLYKHPKLRERHLQLTEDKNSFVGSAPSDIVSRSKRYVVLTTNFSDDNLIRLRSFPVVAELKGKNLSLRPIYYKCSRKGEDEEARAFFEKRGYTVLDLVNPNPWEESLIQQLKRKEEERKQRAKDGAKKRVKKPRIMREGLPVASLLVGKHGLNDHTQINPIEEKDFIDNPDFLIKAPTVDYFRYELHDLGIDAAFLNKFLTIYGDKGAIYKTQRQYDRFVERGAVPVKDYILKKLQEEVETEDFEKYCATNIELLPIDDFGYCGWLRMLQGDVVLAKHFGIERFIPNENYLFIHALETHYQFGIFRPFVIKGKKIEKPALVKMNQRIRRAFSRTEISNYTNLEILRISLKNDRFKEQARELIKAILNEGK